MRQKPQGSWVDSHTDLDAARHQGRCVGATPDAIVSPWKSSTSRATCISCSLLKRKSQRVDAWLNVGPGVFSCLTFVTQQSSPVDIAHTLPGLGAASVHTPRERHTLITQGALPPVMAPNREQFKSHHPDALVFLCANYIVHY